MILCPFSEKVKCFNITEFFIASSAKKGKLKNGDICLPFYFFMYFMKLKLNVTMHVFMRAHCNNSPSGNDKTVIWETKQQNISILNC